MNIAKSLAVAAALFACGCGDETPSEKPVASEPGPSGAVCPPNSALTYDNFASAFFSRNCTRCHSSTLSGTARHGAPMDFNWDTLDGVESRSEQIDAMAAAGPNQINTFMPPSEPRPTQAEREQLGEWIACGMP